MKQFYKNFGLQMVGSAPVSLKCARPGCSSDAAVTLQIDAASSAVTLIDGRTSSSGMALCDSHADSTSAPVGWMLRDQRGVVAANAADGKEEYPDALHVLSEGAPSRIVDRPTKRRVIEQSPSDRIAKFSWHNADSDETLAELKATSPLLARAFRSNN